MMTFYPCGSCPLVLTFMRHSFRSGYKVYEPFDSLTAGRNFLDRVSWIASCLRQEKHRRPPPHTDALA